MTANPWSANHCDTRYDVVGLGDALGMWSAVRVEQHGQRRAVGIDVVGEQHGNGQVAFADGEESHVRLDERSLGERLDLVVARRCQDGGRDARSVERRRTHDRGRSADGGRMHSGLARDCLNAIVGPSPDMELRRIVDRIGAERHDRAARRRLLSRTIERTCRSAGVTGSSAISNRLEPSRSAVITSRPSASRAGVPGTSSTQASS